MYIDLHKFVENDVRQLTSEQEKEAIKAIKRIASGNTKLEDIKELEGFPGFYRWKPSATVRNLCDAEVRVVYNVSEDTVNVVGVFPRKTGYRSIEQRIAKLNKS